MGLSTVASYRPAKSHQPGGLGGAPGRTSAASPLPRPSWLMLIIVTATVAGLTWGLMQQRMPEIDPRDVIALNLTAGQLAFDHARYLEPAEHSAAHYFRLVLALDPANTRAQQGLERIADHFAEQAKSAILNSRFADAAIAIEQLRRLQDNARRLALLESELRESLDAHVAAIESLAQNADPKAGTASSEQRAERSGDDQGSAPTAAATDANLALNHAPKRTEPPARAVSQSTAAGSSRANQQPSSAPASAPSTHASSIERSYQVAKQQLTLPSLSSAAQLAEAQFTAAQRPIAEKEPPAIDSIVVRPPAAVKLVEPHYPEAAQVRGIEGWVDLTLTIAPSGEVIEARVVEREGSRSFERAALQAVRQWRYEPNVAGDAAPSQEIPVRVAFKLQ